MVVGIEVTMEGLEEDIMKVCRNSDVAVMHGKAVVYRYPLTIIPVKIGPPPGRAFRFPVPIKWEVGEISAVITVKKSAALEKGVAMHVGLLMGDAS